MTDVEDITIEEIRIKPRGDGIYAVIYFMLDPPPDFKWQRMFESIYKRHYSLSDHMEVQADCIVLKTPEDFIGPDVKQKTSKDVADTNAAYRESLDRMTREKAEGEERERREEKAKQQRGAELKRKLLDADE